MRRLLVRAVVSALVFGLVCAWVGPAGAEPDESAIQCIQCHVEKKVRLDIIDDWRGSIHFRNDVTCGKCHELAETDVAAIPEPGEGAHTKPDAGTVVFMCGQCHKDYVDYYPESAHFRKERQSCLMCHATGGNSHSIQPASLAIIHPDRCTSCHSFDRAQEAKQALTQAEQSIADLDGMLTQWSASGRGTPALNDLLERARALRTRARLELHTFRLDRIRSVAAEVAKLDDELNAEEQAMLAEYIARSRPQTAVDEAVILCIDCHRDVSDEHVKLIDDWRGSIHYRNHITCGQCHGFSDTDMDAIPDPGEGLHTRPDPDAVVSMCGQCHREWVDFYPLSAHFRKERQSCVMCHASGGDSHNIQAASLSVIREENCSECHSYDWALQAKDTFASISEAHERLGERLASLSAAGYHSIRLEKLQETADELYERVPLELHTFQLKRIKGIGETLGDIDKKIADEEERIRAKLQVQAERKSIGVLMLVACLITSALILAFRQTYIEEWRAAHPPPSADA